VIYELLDKKVHFITTQTLVQSGQHSLQVWKRDSQCHMTTK